MTLSAALEDLISQTPGVGEDLILITPEVRNNSKGNPSWLGDDLICMTPGVRDNFISQTWARENFIIHTFGITEDYISWMPGVRDKYIIRTWL